MKGRLTKFNPEMGEAIAQLVEVGIPLATAARASGVAASTFFRWMKCGREAKRGLHRRFYKRMMEARAKSEARMVGIISLSAERDWRAAAFLLERRNPEAWGQRSKTVLAGDTKAPLFMTAITPEKAHGELLRRLAETKQRFLDAGEITIRLTP